MYTVNNISRDFLRSVFLLGIAHRSGGRDGVQIYRCEKEVGHAAPIKLRA